MVSVHMAIDVNLRIQKKSNKIKNIYFYSFHHKLGRETFPTKIF
jgi:hypothetical protein